MFKILDTKSEDRDPYDTSDLSKFPYVNGGLFADENIEIPHFTEEIKHILLANASDDFDWSAISPTIFGAVFESTLNPETRRSGGMHYTSIENIHKVIDPLFLDDLRVELDEIKAIQVERTRTAKLKAFQSKLAGLKWLDPACGSGNFLTETYICIRRLENEVLLELQHG
jgi:type I restriction-modification system DNA methylase subunit